MTIIPSRECASCVESYLCAQNVLNISPSLLSDNSNIALSTVHKASSDDTGLPPISVVEILTVAVSPGPKVLLFGVTLTSNFLLSEETIMLAWFESRALFEKLSAWAYILGMSVFTSGTMAEPFLPLR